LGVELKETHTNDPKFNNSCAIRLSYALNQSGNSIEHDGNKTVSGADGSWYYYRVNDLGNYLKQTYGEPKKYIPASWKSDVRWNAGYCYVQSSI